MFDANHINAQELAVKANALLPSGNLKEARRLYAEAAKLEKEAFLHISQSKIRTRGILAVSFVSMLYKAEKYNEAEREIFGLLSQNNFLPQTEKQLRELLEVVWDERSLYENAKARYVGKDLFLALRGTDIGLGTAPLDLVMNTTDGFRSLVYRVAEWEGDYKFRLRGLPPKEIKELVQARALQHVAGSYKIGVRLAGPLQLEIFSDIRVSPDHVSNAIFEFLQVLNIGTIDDLEQLIPKENYRNALLKLVRNIAPSGKHVREIELYRDSPQGIQSVLLLDNIKLKISQALPHGDQTYERGQITGTLRALHLDRNWLELVLPKGTREHCDTIPDMLDDVVGPMVNREVIVDGYWKKRPNKKDTFFVEDIQLADI